MSAHSYTVKQKHKTEADKSRICETSRSEPPQERERRRR